MACRLARLPRIATDGRPMAVLLYIKGQEGSESSVELKSAQLLELYPPSLVQLMEESEEFPQIFGVFERFFSGGF